MANPNPKVEHLKASPGKKPKRNTKPITVRLTVSAKEKVEYIAEKLGCTYDGEGSLTKLLSAIANEQLLVVRKPDYVSIKNTSSKSHVDRLPIIDDIDHVVDSSFDGMEPTLLDVQVGKEAEIVKKDEK